ncbi:PML-RARA-regulated adapter molecule 1 [Rhynchocyon petersi]
MAPGVSAPASALLSGPGPRVRSPAVALGTGTSGSLTPPGGPCPVLVHVGRAGADLQLSREGAERCGGVRPLAAALGCARSASPAAHNARLRRCCARFRAHCRLSASSRLFFHSCVVTLPKYSMQEGHQDFRSLQAKFQASQSESSELPKKPPKPEFNKLPTKSSQPELGEHPRKPSQPELSAGPKKFPRLESCPLPKNLPQPEFSETIRKPPQLEPSNPLRPLSEPKFTGFSRKLWPPETSEKPPEPEFTGFPPKPSQPQFTSHPQKLLKPEFTDYPPKPSQPKFSTGPKKPPQPEFTSCSQKSPKPELTGPPGKPSQPEFTDDPQKPPQPEFSAGPRKLPPPEFTDLPRKPSQPEFSAEPQKPSQAEFTDDPQKPSKPEFGIGPKKAPQPRFTDESGMSSQPKITHRPQKPSKPESRSFPKKPSPPEPGVQPWKPPQPQPSDLPKQPPPQLEFIEPLQTPPRRLETSEPPPQPWKPESGASPRKGLQPQQPQFGDLTRTASEPEIPVFPKSLQRREHQTLLEAPQAELGALPRTASVPEFHSLPRKLPQAEPRGPARKFSQPEVGARPGKHAPGAFSPGDFPRKPPLPSSVSESSLPTATRFRAPPARQRPGALARGGASRPGHPPRRRPLPSTGSLGPPPPKPPLPPGLPDIQSFRRPPVATVWCPCRDPEIYELYDEVEPEDSSPRSRGEVSAPQQVPQRPPPDPELRGIRKEKASQSQQVPTLDPKILKQMRKAEKAEKEFRKKFKFEGEIVIQTKMMIDPNAKTRRGGGKHLGIRRGEILEVIEFTNKDEMLCRDAKGKYGYVPRIALLPLETEVYDDVGFWDPLESQPLSRGR